MVDWISGRSSATGALRRPSRGPQGMSISPHIETPPPSGPRESRPVGRFFKWHQRILGFCFAIFALELGLFLLVFPWLRSWDLNWVPLQSPALRTFWLSPYFR